MLRAPRSRVPLAIAGLVAALALSGSALAAFPGTNGRIAFSRSVGTGYDYDLYTMRADGTGRRAVVSSLLVELDPAYSANGRRIVFVRDVDRSLGGVDLEIFTKNLVTGTITRVTRSPAADWDPAWSPGGGRIVFSSDRGPADFDIYVKDLGTGTVTRISTSQANDFAPAWSADGNRIAWSGEVPPGGAHDIFMKNLTTGTITNVTNTPGFSEASPNFSPGGGKLAYQRRPLAGNADSEIWVRTLATGAAVQLTNDALEDIRPAWSPNGAWITWEHSWEMTDVSGQIWKMRADGTGKVALTPRTFDADSPDWQPIP